MSPFVQLLASAVALMMAMGIGRFALTPQLPRLIAEGQFDLTAGGLVAAANYLGYFLGAVDGMFARQPAQVRLRLHGGLWLCVLLTLASAAADGFWSHLLLRFGTGVASAWVLVMIASLSQQLANAHGRQRLGALVFAGPGVGIAVTGVLALGAHLLGLGSPALWLIYAMAALVMLLAVLRWLPRAQEPAPVASNSGPTQGNGIARLGLVYGLYGIGYILPATFLSQMANQQFQGQWMADLFWPAFGLSAALGVVLVSLRRSGRTSAWLTATLWLQGLGVLACLQGGGIGLGLGVVLCGGPFLACMQLVMQRSRELAPHAAQRNAGLLTACFALGQLSGPLLAALSSHFSGGLQPALVMAAAGLGLAGVLVLTGAVPLPASCTGLRRAG
ncbi:MFS transporter [Pseudomonas sichuanensis]|uniref:MFS transporter n=1 Tax=Pseudomonas sichuanensis TaxID=2213015 RepID=UPI00244C52C4|nr:MFS transporter [Pseudomonas sichuanensis]MDH0729369.1 MFS transporter [Pseudomonas sichuanensis]MDH1583136.1 MFS transporter [Pseudomonas sichuanensis]MDH1590706.1 MFS transporter [Pseudomonas sichuanensis]MDH1596097.1 MFS transporter [Pseudomonas sichuanensis]